MEVERLVNQLRCIVYGDIPKDVSKLMSEPVRLNRHRTIATVDKMLVNDKAIPDGERLAGALMQMLGAGGAKPYEVEE